MTPDDAGAWRLYFNGEELAAFPTPQETAQELAAGNTCWAGGIDPATLGLPGDLSAWTRHEGRAQ